MLQVPELPADQKAEALRQVAAQSSTRIWRQSATTTRDDAPFFMHIGNVCRRVGLLQRVVKCVLQQFLAGSACLRLVREVLQPEFQEQPHSVHGRWQTHVSGTVQNVGPLQPCAGMYCKRWVCCNLNNNVKP